MAVRIKRYEEQFDQLDELLARIESEMGPEAELETREFRRGSFLGFGGRRMVEVVATLRINGDAWSHPANQAPEPVAEAEWDETPPEDEFSAAPPEPAAEAAVVAPPLPVTTPPAPAAAPAPAAPVIGAQRQRVDLQADELVQVSLPDAAEPVEIAPPAPVAVPPRPQPEPAPAPRPEPPAPAAITPPPPPAAEVPPAPQPVPAPVPAPEPAAAAPPPAPGGKTEISELRESISELRETVLLLLKAQQGPAAAPPVAASPAAADAAEPDEAAPPAAPVMSAAASRGVADPWALDPAAALDAAPRLVYERLLDWNVAPYSALELINTGLSQLNEPKPSIEILLGAVAREICRNILVSGGIQLRSAPPGKVVALIGATGVGKTTTIAKLAAHFAFQEGKRVSLVSLDNYRIAAAEQLRTYSEIMGVDLDIVFSREEFDAVLTQRKHSDLVLVDTAGRSPLNAHMIQELREVFHSHPPDEVHLVISASTKGDDLRLILRNFEALSYDHVIVSKLDETLSLGAVYNITQHCQVPISYFTIGQSVPEDIRGATLGFIQHWIEQGRFK